MTTEPIEKSVGHPYPLLQDDIARVAAANNKPNTATRREDFFMIFFSRGAAKVQNFIRNNAETTRVLNYILYQTEYFSSFTEFRSNFYSLHTRRCISV